VADLVEREIQQQAVQAAFPAETALLLAGEGTVESEFAVGVRPDYASSQFVHDLENSVISPLDGSVGQVAR
jgi:hypothetical protein